ncbi:hypothetical protein [Deinococcus ficus]|uniref:Uncharacterized protein n=1 Tax=Deinococcus ficus TaxID=317577 RepID=A0A221T334_9DEIO|nr:hypothetical protein [Deinococcus ficus]ASN83305.1 hypothetical protein DFI_19095 [Deinococcus ficus]
MHLRASSLPFTGLGLCALLTACNITTQTVVTTTAYQGVELDLIHLEKQPRTSQGDVQDSLVVRCTDSGRVLLTQRFFPGPDWAVLREPGRITTSGQGLAIQGVGERIVLLPAQVAACS